jgi:hypothetical protein
MKLLAHHTLDGFGGMGEGVAIQCLPQGRRVLWIAHENAPKNFTPVDVTEPRAPRVLVHKRSCRTHRCGQTRSTCPGT